MTNIIAVITITITTNWVSVSRTSPVFNGSEAFQAVMRYDTLNQVGYRVTNTVARIDFEGEVKECVLKSIKSQDVCASRCVADTRSPFSLLNQ